MDYMVIRFGASSIVFPEYAHICWTIYNSAREAVAEIKRKVDASANVVLGKDVFSLCLKSGFDAAFCYAVGACARSNQWDDEDGNSDNNNSVSVHPTIED
ncbi:hypothetical protein QQ045_028699 [Rhodiola kirilowii]